MPERLSIDPRRVATLLGETMGRHDRDIGEPRSEHELDTIQRILWRPGALQQGYAPQHLRDLFGDAYRAAVARRATDENPLTPTEEN